MAYYITQGVNTLLAVGLVFVLVSIAFYSIYYQGVFGIVTTNLTVCNQQFSSCSLSLNQKVTELNTSSTDLEKFEGLYNTQSVELSNTRESLKITTDELNKYRGLYDQAQKNVQSLNSQVSTLAAQITSLNSDIAAIRKDLGKCEDKLDACNATAGG